MKNTNLSKPKVNWVGKLSGTDVQYALKLFAKAIFGQTLQPREVFSPPPPLTPYPALPFYLSLSECES